MESFEQQAIAAARARLRFDPWKLRVKRATAGYARADEFALSMNLAPVAVQKAEHYERGRCGRLRLEQFAQGLGCAPDDLCSNADEWESNHKQYKAFCASKTRDVLGWLEQCV